MFALHISCELLKYHTYMNFFANAKGKIRKDRETRKITLGKM